MIKPYYVKRFEFSTTWNRWFDKSILGRRKANHSWWIWFQGEENHMRFLDQQVFRPADYGPAVKWFSNKNNLDIVNQLERKQRGLFNGEFEKTLRLIQWITLFQNWKMSSQRIWKMWAVSSEKTIIKYELFGINEVFPHILNVKRSWSLDHCNNPWGKMFTRARSTGHTKF